MVLISFVRKKILIQLEKMEMTEEATSDEQKYQINTLPHVLLLITSAKIKPHLFSASYCASCCHKWL